MRFICSCSAAVVYFWVSGKVCFAFMSQFAANDPDSSNGYIPGI